MSVTPKEPGTGRFLGVPYDWRRKGFLSAEAAVVEPGRPSSVHAEDVRLGL